VQGRAKVAGYRSRFTTWPDFAPVCSPSRITAIGHSYGAIVIREFAKDFPTEVKDLVYLDAPDVEMTYAEMDTIRRRRKRLFSAASTTFHRTCYQVCVPKIDNILLLMANDMAEARGVRPPTAIPASERSENPPPAEIVRLQLQIMGSGPSDPKVCDVSPCDRSAHNREILRQLQCPLSCEFRLLSRQCQVSAFSSAIS
jgi:pimeloyl-ACP methyl ester carboxylesterase